MANERQIDLVAKDFDSIVDALIAYATVNFGPDTESNRQWTDFNVDDFSRTWLELLAYVGDLIFYYLDVQATQSNLETATIRSVILNLAKQFGYVVPTATSASGLAKFSLSSATTIPFGFRLASANGSQFYVVSSSPSPGSTTLEPILQVIQGEQKQDTFIASGVQNEEIMLSFTSLVKDQDNSISLLRSPRVLINSVPYILVETFVNSFPTDLHYKLSFNTDGRAILRFGDGIFGKRLEPTDNIVVNYRVGGGSIGNIAGDTLTVLVDSDPNIISVTNTQAFSGGANEPTTDRLKELIPASLRTLERAVALKDYSDILIANFPEVAKAEAELNTDNSGTDINVYVVPVGNTITAITDNVPLLNSISDFLDERKPVTTVVSIRDAYAVDTIFKIEAFLESGISRSDITTTIQTALTTFFDLVSGDIDGTGTKFGQTILLNDLYELLDTIEGINRFEIKKFHYRPRVVVTKASGSSYLLGEVKLFPNAEESEWTVAPQYSATNPEYIPYSVFRKVKGIASNLSEHSISDETLNFSVIESTTSAVNTNGGSNIVFDANKTFIVNEFVGGGYLFVDSANNIWNITDNDSNSIVLSAFAINDVIISDVAAGDYKIVKSLIGANIVFKGLIFSGIDYNTHNTFYRLNSNFNLIGTINDEFLLSEEQDNVGDFGVPTTIDSFSPSTPNPGSGRVHFAGQPDLSGVTVGVNSNFVLIDSNENIFEIIAVSNTNKTVDILHQSGVTTNPLVGGGKPASVCQRYYSDNKEISFVIGITNLETGLGFKANGSITTIPVADLIDGETFTLDDGVNPPFVFEFDDDSSVSGSNVPVDISAITTANQVRDAIISAINGQAIGISASSGGSALVILQNDSYGVLGNNTITETVADADFIVLGMSGGLNVGSLPTPSIPGSTDSPNDLGSDAAGDRLDHFDFRISSYADDVVNLRKNEIPQFDNDDLELDLRGGVI